MTPPQKPEWMELADADSVPVIKKKKHFIPALIASAALAIVGVGAIASQIGEEAPASANEQVLPTQSNSPAAAVALTPATKTPSIASLPKNGGREDHEREGNDD